MEQDAAAVSVDTYALVVRPDFTGGEFFERGGKRCGAENKAGKKKEFH